MALRGLSKSLRRRLGQLSSLKEPLHDSLRCTSSTAAAETAGSSSAPPAAAAELSSSTPDRVAKVIAHSFHRAPKDTAQALLKELSELDRIHLVLALQRTAKTSRASQAETAYVDDLMKQVARSPNTQHAKLTRQQIQNAVVYQRMLQKFGPMSEEPPSLRQLMAVGFATGLPFLAFGVLDNSIMLVAGEQIDHLFGQRLGLTVLASAALGNAVADVVGVTATHTIQENMKRIPFAQPPRLSALQQKMWRVTLFQMGGAAVMVTIGCLLGMTPLLFMDPGVFVPEAAELAASTAGTAAAAMDAGGAAAAAAGGEAVQAAAEAVAEAAAAQGAASTAAGAAGASSGSSSV